MITPIHRLSELFQQLGLGSSTEEVERFIQTHAPLREDIALAEPVRKALQPRAETGAGEITAGNLQPATYCIGHPPGFLSQNPFSARPVPAGLRTRHAPIARPALGWPAWNRP